MWVAGLKLVSEPLVFAGGLLFVGQCFLDGLNRGSDL